MACEDYPCCGHEAGDCPRITKSGREVYRCVECRHELPRGARSSICLRCQKARARHFDEYGGYPEDGY
jgi:hypothetical protein